MDSPVPAQRRKADEFLLILALPLCPALSRFTAPRSASYTGGLLGAPARAARQALFATGPPQPPSWASLPWPGPGATLLAAAGLFAVRPPTYGVFRLADACATHVPGHPRVLGFSGGVLSVPLGLVCFRSAVRSILPLSLWIGFGPLTCGFMLTVAAIPTAGRARRRVRWTVLGALPRSAASC